MTKAFLAVSGSQGAASARIRELVAELTDSVVNALVRRQPAGRHLPYRGHPGPGRARADARRPARRRALLRAVPRGAHRAPARRKRPRKDAQARGAGAARGRERRSASRSTCAALDRCSRSACAGLEPGASPAAIRESTLRDLYDGVPMDEVRKSAILAARALIEKDPAYSYVTARLLLHTIRLEVLGEEVPQARDGDALRRATSREFITRGIAAELLDPELAHVRPGAAGQGAQRRRATCSSATSACRRCTTATSCTSAASASSCRRPSSCAWRWAWR